MVFSSRIFLFVFLPLALLGYYLIRKDFRNIYLLGISFVFYAWAGPKLFVILLACILLNYLCGLLIEFAQKRNIILNRTVVVISVGLNL